ASNRCTLSPYTPLFRSDQARAAAARQDVASIMQALKLYRLDNGRYPTQAQGLQALVQKPAGVDNWRSYLDRLPQDPWGNPYQYRSEEHTSELRSRENLV